MAWVNGWLLGTPRLTADVLSAFPSHSTQLAPQSTGDDWNYAQFCSVTHPKQRGINNYLNLQSCPITPGKPTTQITKVKRETVRERGEEEKRISSLDLNFCS